ncbi:MAG: hypothetical protein EOO91_06555 [Pedobacter sp.]|nr:MAG: hypothetical protein EOO91_06555 [Pedobacter sp.]
MDRATLNLENLPTIDIDYSDLGYHAKARKLKPHILKDGETYYAIYGPDPQVGIFGWGDTPLEAIEDWEKDLEQRIERLTEGDDITNEVISQIGGTNV